MVSQPQSLSYCANTTQNATTTLNSASPTNTQSVPPAAVTSVAKTNTTAAVGGALGGALALVLIGAIVVAILVYRRRMRRLRVLLDDSQDLSQNKQEGIPPSIVTPFLGQYPGGSQVRLEHTPSECTIGRSLVCRVTLPQRGHPECNLGRRLDCTAPHPSLDMGKKDMEFRRRCLSYPRRITCRVQSLFASGTQAGCRSPIHSYLRIIELSTPLVDRYVMN